MCVRSVTTNSPPPPTHITRHTITHTRNTHTHTHTAHAHHCTLTFTNHNIFLITRTYNVWAWLVAIATSLRMTYVCMAMAKELRFAPSFSSYRNYEAEAHELVQKLIRAALERIAAEQSQQKPVQSSEPISWPLGKDFTTEIGLEAIDKFVKVNSRRPFYHRLPKADTLTDGLLASSTSPLMVSAQQRYIWYRSLTLHASFLIRVGWWEAIGSTALTSWNKKIISTYMPLNGVSLRGGNQCPEQLLQFIFTFSGIVR